MTIKVVGAQWYWTYLYPDHGNFEFDSYMIEEQDLKPGQHRLLEVDNRIVIPQDTVVKFLITASDVIHSFAIPALGIKMDAVPGRTNETWTIVANKGVYYGQCSELCGIKHGFMPIALEVVSKEEFNVWIKNKGGKISSETKQESVINMNNKAKEDSATKKIEASKPIVENNINSDASIVKCIRPDST